VGNQELLARVKLALVKDFVSPYAFEQTNNVHFGGETCFSIFPLLKLPCTRLRSQATGISTWEKAYQEAKDLS
jgi:hypothetical protein